MPVDSVEAATKWRSEHAAGRGIGFRSKSAPETESQNGQDSGELAGWQGHSKLQTPRAVARITRDRSLRNIEASLKGAVEIEEAARWQVALATTQKQDARLPNLIAAYNKAREGRYDSEARVLELLKDAGELIPKSDAKAVVAKILGTLFSRLRAVPSKSASRANPADDLLAEGVIREDIDAAISETHAVALESFGISVEEIQAGAA